MHKSSSTTKDMIEGVENTQLAAKIKLVVAYRYVDMSTLNRRRLVLV